MHTRFLDPLGESNGNLHCAQQGKAGQRLRIIRNSDYIFRNLTGTARQLSKTRYRFQISNEHDSRNIDDS
jgi:hypothetical protein